MNSRQRRIDRRRFKHIVHCNYIDYDHYCNMWDWCAATFGNSLRYRKWGWREALNTCGTEFQFVREKDAVAFALKFK